MTRRSSSGIAVLCALPLFGCIAAHDIDSAGSSDSASSNSNEPEPGVTKVSLECMKDVDPLDTLHENLDCAGLYSDIKTKKLAEGVEPYTPAVTLWSDGALKNRWIALPKGKKIDASTANEWNFPVGTKFFKEFIVNNHRIETRLFQKLSDHWVKTTYRWNSTETAATRSLGGDIQINGGTYHLPTGKECDNCHQGRKDRALGFEQIALGLDGAKDLTLPMLVQKKLISPVPAQSSMAIAADQGGLVGQEVIGWLHINCGVSCHNDNATAAGHSTKLRMRLDPAQLDRGAPASEYPTIKTTIGVAATTERWGGKVRIAPGDPSQSLLYQLISVRGGGENDQMPPIASLVVDQDYVTKVADWIRKMPPTSGTVATP